MENSSYTSNALPPSTLVVLSQTANDALRIQRQRSGEENGSFGLRLIEGYPSHLFHHQLFHQSLGGRSAFAPPPIKTFKLEEMLSPISVSVSPSPEDTSPSSSTPDEQLTHNKKTDPSCCPVCGQTVRPGDLDSHFVQELEKLYKITTAARNRRPGEFNSNDESFDNRYEAYLRIRSNRNCRMRMKSRKKKSDDVVCPICNENVYGSMQQLNNHVEICLRKHGSFSEQEEDEEEETVDVEGDTYDGYEWSSQSRIPSILLTARYDRIGNQSAFQKEDGGEVADKEDDSSHYGPPQYTEADILMTTDLSHPRPAAAHQEERITTSNP